MGDIRTPTHKKRNIRKLERQCRARGITGEFAGNTNDLLSEDQYESYLRMQLDADEQIKNQISDREFEDWLESQNEQ